MHGIPASKNVLDAEILSIAGNIEHDSDTCVNYLCSGSELPYLNVSNGNPDTTTYIIPLKKIGRLYILEAVVDGISGNLIFDTGATGLVLNRTYFRNHVKSGGISSSGITGGVGQVDKITADELSIGSLIYTESQLILLIWVILKTGVASRFWDYLVLN